MSITVKSDDIGRTVIYSPSHGPAERGVITGIIGLDLVHVRYGDETTAKATKVEDLDWPEAIYERALELIFGTIPMDTWVQVSKGLILPPWPLPSIIDGCGLSIGKSKEFLIWSEEHRRWWMPGRHGYTNLISQAGRYSKADADQIVASANYGSNFNEIAIPLPAGLDALIGRPVA